MPNYKLRRYDNEGNETPQYGFHMSRNAIQIFGGAFANGKTTALVIKALKLAQCYPGSNGLLARETYPKLNDTLRKVFLEWCPDAWIRRRPTQEDNSCYLHNGTVVNFRYVAQRGKAREDGSTTSNLLSATYDWIGVDQVEDPGITHKDFLDLLGRLRGNTSYKPPLDEEEDETMPLNGPQWLMLTSNPSANWFYKEVVQPVIVWRDKGQKVEKLLVDGQTGVPIVDLFEGSTYSNAENLDPRYLRNLEAAYRGQMRERYLLGKWAAFEGLVHPDFSMDSNVITRMEMETHLINCLGRHINLTALEGYDFGMVSPSCYLLAFTDDYGRVFVLDGYYKPEFHYMLQPDEIRRIRNKYAGQLMITEPIYADPAIFRKQNVGSFKHVATSIRDLFAEQGIEMRPGGNDVLPGIAKVNSYITGRMDIPHAITGEKPGPMLYVCDDLEFFQEEIFSYYWKRNPQGTFVDEPIDNNDHAMNTIKYMLSKLPDPSEVVIPVDKLPPQWLYWHEVEESQYVQ